MHNHILMVKIDKLVRTSRKTIALIVRRDGQLEVRAPYKATNAQIMQFIDQKEAWITKKQTEAQTRKTQINRRQYTAGETFLYLGQAYPLEIVETGRVALLLKEGQFRLAKRSLSQAKEVFTVWYQARAREMLEERVRLYAQRYNLTYQQLRISSARTRWGSCSSKGTLSFTWRLVMAPLPVIDYVVVHELAHLTEHNHSNRFWQRVAELMPDYAQRMAWLKQNGHFLNLE